MASLSGDEKAIRKQIKVELKRTDRMAVVDFNGLEETHFVRFVLALSRSDGGRFVFGTYNTHRAGFNHLFRI